MARAFAFETRAAPHSELNSRCLQASENASLIEPNPRLASLNSVNRTIKLSGVIAGFPSLLPASIKQSLDLIKATCMQTSSANRLSPLTSELKSVHVHRFTRRAFFIFPVYVSGRECHSVLLILIVLRYRDADQ